MKILYPNWKTPNRHVEWRDACTLNDFVIKSFETNQTGAPYFKALERFYGRNRIAKIWTQHSEKKSNQRQERVSH